ncbi:MAG: adenylate/guanylate cyclase domain-containing protein [Actinomycetota bacterium]
MEESHTFWERLAARTTPSGALETVEDPMTVVRLVTGVLLFSVLAASTSAAWLFLLNEPATGFVFIAQATVLTTAWVWYATTGSTRGMAFIALLGGAVTIVFAHAVLGGYAYSGAQLTWGILFTLYAALVLERRWTAALGLFFIALAVVFGLLEDDLAAGRPAPDPALSAALFTIVLVGVIVLTAPVFVIVLERLSVERSRAESLFLNVFPAEVAGEFKRRGETTARRFESISVLFADIVGFTPLAAEMDPEKMVAQLNEVFTSFDQLADRYGCEKIRTIGDNYMVASGVPTPREDHAEALAGMALEMIRYAEGSPWSFRIGINSGPAVAGVIGTKKFQYDVWGDTVNTASRMESHGEPGRIQIGEATNSLIKDHYATTPRGPIEVKGKGTLNTWWLEGTRELVTAG